MIEDKQRADVRGCVAHRFSAAAEHYDDAAGVQNAVAERLLSFLERTPDPQSILEIGCGTGLLTQRLRDHFPGTPLQAIDFSPRMITQAKQRLGDDPAIHWRTADAADFLVEETYPLVVSSSSLHWVSPMGDVFHRIADALAPGGTLAFSVMLHGTLSELHEARLAVASHKPPLQRLPQQKHIEEAVSAAGLHIVDRQAETIQSRFYCAADFLNSIHDQGVTGGPFSRSPVPLNREELRQLIKRYDEIYVHPEGGVRASYDILYLVARKSL